MAPYTKRKALKQISTNHPRWVGKPNRVTTKTKQHFSPAPSLPCRCLGPSRTSRPQSLQALESITDSDYDPLWHVLRQQKIQSYLQPQHQQSHARLDMIGGKSVTSSENLEKGNKRWKERYLHPRYIRIQEGSDLDGKLASEHLLELRRLADTDKSERHIIGNGTFVEELTDDILREMHDWAFALRKLQANEARWEADYWQTYFLKSSRQLDSMKTTQAPVIHRIPQAPIAIAHEQAKLTPLIADSPEDRRESGLLVDTIVWQPSVSSKTQAERLWYPDHQYAITTKHFASGRQVESLPFFRLALASYLPAHLLVEVKAEAKRIDWEQTQNSLAFLTAYLLHERILLRFLSRTASIEKDQCIDVGDLHVHALSLCGSEAKIWRMHVRGGDDLTALPIRYDMHLIAKLDSAIDDHAHQIRSWINAINAHAQAAMFLSLQQDFKFYDNLHKTRGTMHLQDIGFVYSESSNGERLVTAKPLKVLRDAFRKGVIKPEERIGDSVIFDIDKDGNAMEMPIGANYPFPIPPKSERSAAATRDDQSVGDTSKKRTWGTAATGSTCIAKHEAPRRSKRLKKS